MTFRDDLDHAEMGPDFNGMREQVRHFGGRSVGGDIDVFTGPLKQGVAEGIVAKEGGKTIIDFLREAKEAGVEMKVCSAALQLHDMTEDDLIDECDEVVGAAYMTDVGLEADLVLCY